MSVAFTSSAASNQIANRTVRALGAYSMGTVGILGNIIAPVSTQLTQSGKLRRGALKPLCQKLVRRLKTEKAVMHVVAESLNSPISTREEFDVRFIFGLSDTESILMGFMCCELFLTRKNVVTQMSDTDIQVHAHALSKFMQREQKPLTEFFAQIMEPLQLSYMLAPDAAKSGKIAVSMGSGLLLGNVVEIDEPGSVTYYDINGKDVPEIKKRRRDDDTRRFAVKLMTYVDGESMFEVKTALHQRLSTFYHKHKTACSIMFDAGNFDMMLMRAKDVPGLAKACSLASADLEEIAASNEWRTFTSE